jgi:hypothetical protein
MADEDDDKKPPQLLPNGYSFANFECLQALTTARENSKQRLAHLMQQEGNLETLGRAMRALLLSEDPAETAATIAKAHPLLLKDIALIATFGLREALWMIEQDAISESN